MRKLPEHSRVRRRLFPEISDEAAVDNFANMLQESSKIDRDNLTKKWNFDFANDLPLEGPYEWYRKDGDTWIGMKPDKSKEVNEKTEFDDKFVPISVVNEITPKPNNNVKDDSVPVIRKRRRDDSFVNGGARRKISFD